MGLATDMARHGALMDRIKQKLAEPARHPLQTPEGIDLVLQIALKCADISNQARPWRVARKWNDAVYCPVPLTVRGTQTLVSFAPLAFKLFYAARQNAVLRRSSFPSP